MKTVRKFIFTHLWWLVLITALSFLIIHSFGITKVVVDNTTLILLVLILISPFITAIKKIKIGEFEAEIQPEEVKRLADEAEKSITKTTSEPEFSYVATEEIQALKTLSTIDPVLALAKLRIEIESRLKKLHRSVRPTGLEMNKAMSLSKIIQDITSDETFTKEFGGALRGVIGISNRAIHGEDIRNIDAQTIIETGCELLEELERILYEYAATHPIETTVISHEELNNFSVATYKLTTMIPYAEEPQRRTYILTQNELDAFLENYPEFAEFAVALERIEAPSSE